MSAATNESAGITSLRRRAANAELLSLEDEQTLVAAIRNGDARALDRLLTAHLRLVFSIARSFSRYEVSVDELVGEGLLALSEAAQRFDGERGVRFATYARCWVHAYVRRCTLQNRRIVPAPSTRNARKVLAHLRTTERKLTQAQGGAPSEEALAAAMDVTVEDVRMVTAALSARDVPILEESDTPRGVESSPEDLVSDAQERMQLDETLHRALATLSDRERDIVRRRIDDEGQTFESIGQSLGLSRERVRQLEARAKQKLKVALGNIAA